MNAKPIYGTKLCSKSQVHFWRVFREAASNYVATRMHPYLKLPGIVEMDETYIGKKKFFRNDHYPHIRWIFGMHC